MRRVLRLIDWLPTFLPLLLLLGLVVGVTAPAQLIINF